jgi:ribosome recycling factor
MSLLRSLLSRTRTVTVRSAPGRICVQPNTYTSASTSSLPHFRSYASKSKTAKSTATLVPGSQQKLTDEAAIEEYEKAEKKMQGAVEWYRKEVAGLETRASGRVTPALLASVRVELPDSKGELFRLEDVATVGVREGSTLLVTVFEEHVSVTVFLFCVVNISSGLVDHEVCRKCTI